jgi:autotransporter-associated beta strand protein
LSNGCFNKTGPAGGVLIDIPDGVVAVGTQDLQGNGGLTKQGSGMLLLNGANGYTGATLVNAGILGGAGVFSGFGMSVALPVGSSFTNY